MPWLETAFPVRMTRIALVAPAERLRDMLVRVAAAGVVEIDGDSGAAPSAGQPPVSEAGPSGQPASGLAPVGAHGGEALLSAALPDLAALAEPAGPT